jgi:type I restriction enzyme S subunit
MERYDVCLPDGAALEAFNAIVDPLLDRVIANVHESRTLAATRDTLLPKLVSGAIRVKDAEAFLKARGL